MKCSEAVETIIRHRGRAIVVSTMSAIKHVDRLDPDGLNIACVPLMGGASALGLGLALAQPDRPVLVLDGDGSLVMQLGSLVSTAELRPPNFVHFVFNNGVWFENLANIPIPASGKLDFITLARAAGNAAVSRFHDAAQLEAAMPELTRPSGPRFVELMIEPEGGALWSPGNPQAELKDFHFTRMGDEARRMRERLLQAEGDS